MGLFANEWIRKNTLVAFMKQPTILDKFDFEASRNVHHWPHDSAVEIDKSEKKVMMDMSWKDWNIPVWYRINHSSQPNTEMLLIHYDLGDGKKNQTIGWFATKVIRPGDEITFEYVHPDENWVD
jgi:hypothetical protein